MVSDDLKRAVDEAIHWLKYHPGRDYLDAAYGIAVWGRPYSNIAGSRWPEFVAAVKEASQKLASSA
jgi:hypothetical protein